ncbi:N-acetyltransferase [Kaistia sp. 32K]|uniref:GNAT family N-acetyltransferase n=1 Tax=Kaistia sp. 32K TaxID=2795690 RepID=UPI001914F353|nr:GNAT family N-acetyltransferase [Kaistia sp. 32K]BCP55621.1 N-acetyltransferase [Kaistia sp. 32K]
MLPEKTIQTANVLLRPLRPGDGPAIVSGLSDYEVTRWLARVPYPYSLDEALRFLAWERAQRPVSAEQVYAIDRGGMIGLISLRDAGPRPVLGYWLAREHWGNRYMSEAAAALVEDTFDDPDIIEIQSGVFEGNERSLAIQKRLGFEIIGRSIQHNLALGRDLAHIDTALTRARHYELKT